MLRWGALSGSSQERSWIEAYDGSRCRASAITDKSLKALLVYLARAGLNNGGIVLVGSRYPLADLAQFKMDDRNGGYCEIELTALKEEFGAKLLGKKVHGGVKDLLELSREMEGNPLALLLVGSLLEHKYGGNGAMWRELPSVLGDKEDEPFTSYVEKAIRWYDFFLTDDERTFLRLLGLFGRKMKEEDLEVLLDSTAGKTLARLSDDQLNTMYTKLSDYNLISGENEATHK